MFQVPEMVESFLRLFHSLSRSLHPTENLCLSRIVALESRFVDYIRCGISMTSHLVDLKTSGGGYSIASDHELE
jgi:hypothetical protein